MRSLTFPDPTRIVLGTRDDRVSFIIERTTENLIRVTLEHLQTIARLDFPQPRDFVTAGRQDFRSLGIKAYFRDLAFVSDENRLAGPGHGIIDARGAIS